MSKTVDERVVEMRFDNAQFEKNVQTSMSTLEKLKNSLNLSGASKGLEGISNAAKRVDMSPMANGIETVRMKFSALEVVAVTALANITNSAVNAGTRLVKSLSLDQITAGMTKYEQKTASVQTIMNSTGLSISEVNDILSQLMWFSDETSYGFTDMTAALAQMTSSGGDVKKLIPLITGVANATAYAGKGATEFSRVMYNLNQSYGAGYLSLMDWKSVELAGVGSKELKQVIIDTAVALGKIKEGQVTIGTFSETLGDKWADTEVMEAAFGKFSELSEAAYAAVEAGEYDTASEAIAALSENYSDLASKAFRSAQEAKSFTEAIEATKDAVSSGWMTTFETIFGNYEEAKELWTDLANALWDVFASGAEARNEMLSEWKELGGRNDLIESFWNTWEAVGSIISPIKEAFRDIFPAMTAEKLFGITEALKTFTSKLTLSDAASAKLKSTFKGLFAVMSMLGKVALAVGSAFMKLITSSGIKALANMLLTITAAIGDFIVSLNESFDTNGLTGVLTTITGGISNVLGLAVNALNNFGSILPNIGDGIVKVVSKIWESFKTVFGWISDNFSAGDLFAGLAGGGIFVAAKKIADLFGTIKDKFENFFGGKYGGGLKRIGEPFSDILDSIHDSLVSFTTGIKATTLLTIAAAIGILSASLKSIAGLKAADISKSLLAIGSMFVMLNLSFKSINKTLDKYDSKGLLKAGASILIISFAISNLASAMVKMSGLSWNEIAKGLTAIGFGLAELCLGLKAIKNVKVSLSTAVVMLALAESCKILGDALGKFGQMSWGEIAKGLVGMGGALAEFVIALKALDKIGGLKSILTSTALLIAVQSLDTMADGLKKFGQMSWDEIKRGLAGMGGALAEVSAALIATSKIAGFKSIFASGAILIVVQGLGDLAEALKEFGHMTWDEIKRGLTAMGGALAEVAIAVGALGKLAGFSSLFGAGSILIVIQGLGDLADALFRFGLMSWEEIERGLVGLGGSLGEIAVIAGALGKLAGFSGLLGSGSILVLIQGLGDLVDAFKKFGGMSWDEIKQGLVGMGGALTELGVVSGLLGKLAGFSGMLGSGSLLIAIQGLGDLVDAFKKFGEMSWEEIERGLVGLGGALTELGVVSGLLGGLAGLPALLGSGSLLLAIQGLGDLADAFKKFGEMSWEEITRGLTAMGGALAEVALGGLANTLSGLGALSIKEIAEPLGVLAESIKKWSGVTVPEGLGGQLAILANGIGAFTFDGLGASALSTAAPSIGVMADSIKKWSGVTVPENLGEQLETLASGIRSFTFDGMGASALTTAAPAIGEMADSIRKWSGVTVPDNIGDGLSQIASGVKAFSFAFVGGVSLNTVIGPLGDLAGSVRKWSGVTVPENIGDGLKQIASGVKAFSFAFMGGWSLDVIVGPLGDLAGSIKKWNGVSVPEGLKDGLSQIASGVKSFSFAFMGGWSLDAIIGPLGDLATSVKKWNGVSVPEGLKDGLDQIASGVKSFSLAFIGGWSLGSITAPLGDLATSVKKWNGVLVPSGIETQLTNLANGVKAFTGVGDITSTVTNINKIAVAMTTLNGIGFEVVSNGLATIATSIQNFASSTSSLTGVGDSIINNIIMPIQGASSQLTEAVNSMIETAATSLSGCGTRFNAAGQQAISGFVTAFSSGGAQVSAAMNTMIETAATSLSGCGTRFNAAGQQAISGFVTAFSSGGAQVSAAMNTMMSSVVSSLTGRQAMFVTAGASMMAGLRAGITSGSASVAPAVVSSISRVFTVVVSQRARFTAAGTQLMVGLRSGMTSGSAGVMSTVTMVITKAYTMAVSRRSQFMNAGRQLAVALANGLKTGSAMIKTAISSSLTSSSNAIRSHYSSFKSAGKYLGDGLVAGINAKKQAAYDAGYALGKKAVEGEKAGQQSNSPSKATEKAGKWLGEGLVIGIERMGTAVYKSGKSMGETAVDSISGALDSINNLSGLSFSDVDNTMTIRPVLDMTDLQNGVGQIDDLFNTQTSVGLTARMNTLRGVLGRNGGANSNTEVVSAINKLRKDIGNISNNNYTINGVTYDDGSNVSDAIQSLVRAVKIERRR